MSFRFLIFILVVSAVTAVAAQTPAPSAAQATPPTAVSELDPYVKVAGAIVTGVATLLGLPIVFLTYRKTRAEIAKLELEANALRGKLAETPNQSKDDEGNIRILVDRSPNTSIQILADPRFLAPLLILLDFIFAWVILTFAGYLISIFGLGPFGDFALAVLAGSLLLPLARQVMRVRSVIRPPRTPEEVRVSLQQAKLTALTIYATCLLSSLVIGILMLYTLEGLTERGRYFAWGLIGLGIVMSALAPIARSRFHRYLTRMQAADTNEVTRA